MAFAFLKRWAYGEFMSEYSHMIIDRAYNENDLAYVDPDFAIDFNAGPIRWEANTSERAHQALLVARHVMDEVIGDSGEYADRVHTVSYENASRIGFLVMSNVYSPRQMTDLQRHLAGRVNDRLGDVTTSFWLPLPQKSLRG